MDTKEMFTIILKEIRESHTETKKRLDNVDSRLNSVDKRLDSLDKRFDSVDDRLANLELEMKATKQLVQNFKWDIDLLSNKQTKLELDINRLERRIET